MRIVLPNMEEWPSDWAQAKPKLQEDMRRLSATINQTWIEEHTADGAHGAITATSLQLQGAQVGVWTDVRFDLQRFFAEATAVWEVDFADVNYLKFMRIGAMATVLFSVHDSALTTAVSECLSIRLPELHAIPISGSTVTRQIWLGGTCKWEDTDNGLSGIGTVEAIAIPDSTVPQTILQIRRIGPTTAEFEDFAVSTDFTISGYCTFPVNTNNVPLPFSF